MDGVELEDAATGVIDGATGTVNADGAVGAAWGADAVEILMEMAEEVSTGGVTSQRYPIVEKS